MFSGVNLLWAFQGYAFSQTCWRQILCQSFGDSDAVWDLWWLWHSGTTMVRTSNNDDAHHHNNNDDDRNSKVMTSESKTTVTTLSTYLQDFRHQKANMVFVLMYLTYVLLDILRNIFWFYLYTYYQYIAYRKQSPEVGYVLQYNVSIVCLSLFSSYSLPSNSSPWTITIW